MLSYWRTQKLGKYDQTGNLKKHSSVLCKYCEDFTVKIFLTHVSFLIVLQDFSA